MSDQLTIVVPTDFSPGSLAALEWVKRLDTLGSVNVHCVNVAQDLSLYMPVMAGSVVQNAPPINELKQIAAESLATFIEQHMSDRDPAVVSSVLVGRPAEEICQYAKEVDADMIVIGARGHSQLAQLLIGSTTEGVVRQAQCAVLTVRP